MRIPLNRKTVDATAKYKWHLRFVWWPMIVPGGDGVRYLVWLRRVNRRAVKHVVMDWETEGPKAGQLLERVTHEWEWIL